MLKSNGSMGCLSDAVVNESVIDGRTFKFHRPATASALVLALLALAPGAAQSITVDSFATDQSLMLTFPPALTSASSSVSGAGILGGERDIGIGLTSGVIAGNTVSSVVSSGFLSYSQDATIAGTAIIVWDGADGSDALNWTGLGGIDLTNSGQEDALVLSIAFDDLPLNAVINVITDAGNASFATLPLPGLIFATTNYTIPFSAFTPWAGAGADFANVGAITFEAGSNVTAPDLVVDSVATAALINATETVALLNDVNSNSQVDPGDTLRYTVTITNPDDAFDASATGVAFANAAPANTTLVVGSTTTTQGTVTSGNTAGDTSVGVNVGTLPDAGSATITFDVTVDDPLPAGITQISSQGTLTSDSLTGALSDDPGVAGTSDATVIAVVQPQADLSITKTDGVATATPGGSVTYTITASNAGPSAAPSVTVADTLPAVLTGTWTCVGAGGGTCTASGSGNINDTANLPAGGSVTYTVTASIGAGATGTLANTATVSSAITDPDPANNSATDTDTLTPQADLGITKTDGVTSATAGGSVTYTITASNAGPSDAPSAMVADTLPAVLTGTWTCVGAGGGTCAASGSGDINDAANLPAGGSVTYTVAASIDAGATGTLANTATVSSAVTDPNPADNSATDTDTLSPPSDLLTDIPTRQGGVTANLAVEGCSSIDSAIFIDAPAGAPAGIQFPFGLADFSLSGCAGTATVTVTYSQNLPNGATFYKEQAGTYATYAATLGVNSVTFSLTDNGTGDSNPAQGVIDDPSGIGVMAAAAPASIPALSGWGAIALSGLMLFAALGMLRRRGQVNY
jgi:uncharacterized repeat protein (TIGR01451 family)